MAGIVPGPLPAITYLNVPWILQGVWVRITVILRIEKRSTNLTEVTSLECFRVSTKKLPRCGLR